MFGGTDAKLCVGGCKALRWQLQSFALADAMLCVRVVLNWQRNVLFWIREKGEDAPYGSLILQEISTAP